MRKSIFISSFIFSLLKVFYINNSNYICNPLCNELYNTFAKVNTFI
nr:MAG TPA: hypothetical protein [Caudoviricetes sp.]